MRHYFYTSSSPDPSRKRVRTTLFLPIFLFLMCYTLIITQTPISAADSIELFTVSIQESSAGTRVHFMSSEPLLFRDTKLSDPDRVVIDLIGPKIYTRENDTIAVTGGSIQKIINSFYDNMETEQGRRLDQITIVLTDDLPYKISQDANILQVDIASPSRAPVSAAQKADAANISQPVMPGRNASKTRVVVSPPPKRSKQGITRKLSGDLRPEDVDDPELRALLFPSDTVSQPASVQHVPNVVRHSSMPAPQQSAQEIKPVKVTPDMIDNIDFKEVVKEYIQPVYPDASQPVVVDPEGMLDLEQCMVLALQNHRPAKISREEIELAEMRLVEAKRTFYPAAVLKYEHSQAEVSGGLADRRSHRYRMEFEQPIYKGGELKNAYRQAKVNLTLARKRYAKVKADLAYEVEKAYYTFAAAKLKIAQQEELLKDIGTVLDLLTKRYDLGFSRRLDLLKVQSQYQEVQRSLVGSKDEVALGALALQQVLNIDFPVDIDAGLLLKRVKLDTEMEGCIKLAMDNRPDLVINRLLVEFHEYNLKIAASRLHPQVNMTGAVGLGAENYTTEPLSYGADWFLGLEVSYPLGPHSVKSTYIHQDASQTAGQTDSTKFDSQQFELGLFDAQYMRLRGDRQSAVIEYEKAVEQFDNTKQSVVYEVKESYFNYKKALLLIADYSSRVNLGVEQVKVNQAMYKLNELPADELVKSKLELNKTQVSYFQSLADQHIAVAGLNKAIGIYGHFR